MANTANVTMNKKQMAQAFEAFYEKYVSEHQGQPAKRRGRPPKVQTGEQEAPKRRGRPPKSAAATAQPSRRAAEANEMSILEKTRSELPNLDENASKIYDNAAHLTISSLYTLIAHLDATARSMITRHNPPNLEVGKRVKIIGAPSGKNQYLAKKGRVLELHGNTTVIQLEETENQISVPTNFLELVRGRAPGQHPETATPVENQPAKRRGRPPGSKNKPKDEEHIETTSAASAPAETKQDDKTVHHAPTQSTSSRIEKLLDESDPEREAIKSEGK